MSRKPGESPFEYRQRVMDPISSIYCGAKWLNATIWLSSGQTASCHHPPPHRISEEEIKINPSALHNTKHKMLRRAQMLKGERPKECEYCWKIEDLKQEQVSDRYHKTEMFSDEDHERIKKLPWDHPSLLRSLEIAFDRNCQFACSYCNAGYSTKWSQEIKKFGPYQNMQSDGAGAYWHHGEWSEKYKDPENQPFVSAFWNWWPELSQTLEEFKVTGGEPFMSPHFWKLLKLFGEHPPRQEMLFSVNSNLGFSQDLLEKFFALTKSVDKIGIYTSCEATGALAEYLRDGLKYEQYINNLKYLISQKRLSRLQNMITISSLALYGLTEWCDVVIELREQTHHPLAFGVTILRFPSFMSPATLPFELRMERANHIENWYKRTKNRLLPHEDETLARLISYLREAIDPHAQASDLQLRQMDLKAFFRQYDQRRGKKLEQVVPKIFFDWYNSIPEHHSHQQQKLYEGDATEGYHLENENREIIKRLNL